MRLLTFFLAIPFLVAALSRGLSHKPRHKSARETAIAPLWRADLRAFGYQGYEPPREFPANSVLEPLGFSSRSVLIASFLMRETVAAAPHRSQRSAKLPLKLRAVFLNAATGKLLVTKGWSIPYPVNVDVVPTRHGQFVVIIRQNLTLYSRYLKPLKRLELATQEGTRGDIQEIEVSPQKGSLLVVFFNGERSINWIRTDDLEPMGSWNGPLTPETISDDKLAAVKEMQLPARGPIINEVLLRSAGAPWRTFCRVRLGYDSDTDCSYPTFVTNRLLAFWMPHELSMQSIQGNSPLLIAQFPPNEWIGRPLCPSANGERLALSIWAQRGGSEILDINGHSVLKRIMVFDIPSRQWIYTLDAKKQKIRTISGLALSPDGSLMAILTNGIVEVYRLPHSPPGQPAPQQ